jgi:trigger factor
VKVTKDKIEGRQAYLTVEMEPSELEEGLTGAYNRQVKKANIPGFRKGKAPRALLEQYMGKSALVEDAVEHMAPNAYQKAILEQDLKPIARPEIQLEKLEPVTYKMIVPLEPIIKLGDYHQIKMTPEPAELKQEDVEKSLEEIRKQHCVWEPVTRQVNSRDMVIMDIESNIGNQPYINQKDAELQIEKESEFPMKGFSEALIGLKSGETKEFKLSYAQDHPRAELAGKEASFKVTIKEIKQPKLPELNDDLASQVNPEFKTLQDLKNKITEGLKQSAEDKAKKDFQQKLVDAIVAQSEIEYPVVLEEEEIDQLINQQMQRWQMDEKGMDEYLASIKKTPEDLRNEFRSVAIRIVKQSLVLTEVAKAEKIQIEESDLKNEIENMTKDITDDRKEKLMEILQVPQNQANLASSIATRKVIEKITEIAQSSATSPEKGDKTEVKQAEAT